MLFYFILQKIFLFPLDNVTTILAARVLFALIGLGIATLTFQIAKLIFKDSMKAWVALLLLVANTFFLGQGFRVRSDLLAALFQLLTLYTYLSWYRSQPQKMDLKTGARLGLFSLLMVLCTPKAVYPLILNSIFMFLSWPLQINKKRFLLTVSIIVIPLLVFAGLFFLKPQQLHSALQYYLNSFMEYPGHPAFFSQEGFFYLFRLLKENPIFILLFFCSLWFLRKVNDALIKALYITSLLSLFIIFAHNDRLPFFILSLLPLPIILASHSMECLYKKWSHENIFSILAFYLLVNAVYFYVPMKETNNNHEQKYSIRFLEKYLAQYPKARYFDGIGALPRLTQSFAYVAPDTPGNKEYIMNVIRNQDLIFLSSRMFFYFQDIFEFFDDNNYVHIGGGVYAKAERPQDCNPTKGKTLYYYSGNNKLNATPKADDLKNHIACSIYKRVLSTGEKTFGQIFDYDRNF